MNLVLAIVHSLCLLSAMCLDFNHGGIAKAFGGTSHGGGGNGQNGKVYEAYIEPHPEQLPAYLFLEKKLAKNTWLLEVFKASAFQKTWYFINDDLKRISKTKLGVSFLLQNTDQLAFQTAHEIWFDSISFEGQPDEPQSERIERQAMLLLHELVESVYLLKFRNAGELCKIFSSVNERDSRCSEAEGLKELIPYELPRELDSTDYEIIRRVTGWLYHNAELKSSQEVFQQFIINNFGRIFSNSEENYEKVEPRALPSADFLNVMNSAKFLGYLQNDCLLVELGESIPCEVRVADSEQKLSGLVRSEQGGAHVQSKNFEVQVQGFDLTLNRMDTDELLSHAFFPLIGNVYVSQYLDHNSQKSLFLVPATPFSTNVKPGEKFRNVFLIFVENTGLPNSLRFEGFVSIPGVVLDVRNDGSSMKCITAKPKVRDQGSDAIILVDDPRHLKYLKFFSQHVEPFILCN